MSLNWTGSPDTEIKFARLTGQPLSTTTDKVITISIPDIGSKTITMTTEGLIY